MGKLIKVVLIAFTFSTVATVVSANSNQMQIIVSGPNSEGFTRVGICFTNPSEMSGWVSKTESYGGSGGFTKHSGTPACPNFASGNHVKELTPGVTYNFSATASNNGRDYTAATSYTAPANTSIPSPTPTQSATSVATSSPSPTPTPSPTRTPTPAPIVESDGTEEGPAATIDAYKRPGGKYLLVINSNIPEERLTVTATRKGFKTISYRAQTNYFGDVSILTTRNLLGFTLNLRYEKQFLDRVTVK